MYVVHPGDVESGESIAIQPLHNHPRPIMRPSYTPSVVETIIDYNYNPGAALQARDHETVVDYDESTGPTLQAPDDEAIVNSDHNAGAAPQVPDDETTAEPERRMIETRPNLGMAYEGTRFAEFQEFWAQQGEDGMLFGSSQARQRRLEDARERRRRGEFVDEVSSRLRAYGLL